MDHHRVLHVIWSANLGGITRLVSNLCEYQRMNHLAKSDILVCKKDSSSNNESGLDRIKPHRIDLLSGADFSPWKINKCIRLMKQYDIIHLHIFHPLISFAVLRSGRRVVFTEHGNFGIGRYTGLRGTVNRLLKTRFLQRSDLPITCNSMFTARTLSRINHIPQHKINVVYNGLSDSTTALATKNTWRKEGEFLVVSIGRLAQVKRFDRVIEAFIQANVSNSRLLIMGDGPEMTYLKHLVAKHQAESSIEFVGPGNGLALLQEANLCIIGSQGEAFGLVAIEAYQKGKRVLVFEDGGGVTEIIQPIDPEAICLDIPMMAEQIRSSHENDRTKDPQWKDQAVKRATEFSIQKMAEAFNRLYQF
jgi:glycosyltransferase involved in cell wall biosynthesis